MSSYPTNESTTSLISTHQKSTTKDYEAAVGQLSSAYGLTGAPTVTQKKSTTPKTNATAPKASTDSTQNKGGSSANKNYNAAFGALSSSYGFGGGVPSVAVKKPNTPKSLRDKDNSDARAPGTIPFLLSRST